MNKNKEQKLSLWQLLFFIPLLSIAQDVAEEATSEVTGQTDSSAEESQLIRLESTFIGDKEQPSVSYFIPWKGTDSADGLRWQIERKNDDTLNPVDRDILLRSINIYNEMKLER